MNDSRLRHDWISRVPGLELKSTLLDDPENHDPNQQHLITYEPGDATHYATSLSWARFAPLSSRLGYCKFEYFQFSVWSGSGAGNGTMLIQAAGNVGLAVKELDLIQEKLRCSAYSAQVFAIIIHGCLVSHDLREAQKHIKHFRDSGRLGFVDPDADS